MAHLNDFEIDFGESFAMLNKEQRQMAGALLPIIPQRERWEDFLAAVRDEWHAWRRDLTKYPKCLVVLYGGLAFYEYDENTFWPQFSKAVGSEHLQQTDINIFFALAAETHGLKIQKSNKGTEYVGSAVYHIGIPLSLWEGFLDICEWACDLKRWQEAWETLTDEEWADAIGKRAGGRQRLKRFLIANRDAATASIKEMLDAREILTTNQDYSIADIKQLCFRRAEYFDEVPETAEFLRPQNPESLFHDRARLICNLQRCCISLQLPAVKKNNLPARWILGTCSQQAAATPDIFTLNSEAFASKLLLKLDTRASNEIQFLRGIKPWGIFELEKGEFVNPNRQQLPLRSYAVIAPEKLEISRKGFDEEETPINELFELADGTRCFITQLWPNGKYAELLLKHDGCEAKIHFRAKARIEARFFVGWGSRAANFEYIDATTIKTDSLPTLCTAIPKGYFNDITAALNKFRVLMDGKSAGGHWQRQNTQDDDRDFYIWKWASTPFIEQKKSGVEKDFSKLHEYFKSPDLKGAHNFSIKSPEFKMDYLIHIDHSNHEIRKCWNNLPGAFLLWFLLCQPNQKNEGMKWEDLMLAKDIIEPNERNCRPYLLRKYENERLLVQKGRYWMIAESRAAFKYTEDNQCILQYCGDPSILWGLYRRMCNWEALKNLPPIDVIDKRGTLPYLEMVWARYRKSEIEKYLLKRGVHMGDTLWTH